MTTSGEFLAWLLAGSFALVLAGASIILRDRSDDEDWAERVLLADRSPSRSAFARGEARVDATRVGRFVATRLSSAGISIRPTRALAVVVVLGSLGFAMIAIVTSVWMATIAATAGALVGKRLLALRRRRRHELFVEQLSDVATAMAVSSTSRSVADALERTAKRVPEPAASVLGQVVGRIALGWSVADALNELRREIPDQRVGLLVSTLLANDTSGGDLGRALESITSTLEAETKLMREVGTQMSGPLAASRTVAVIGIAMPLVINAISDDALHQLVGTDIGLLVVSGAALLYLVGLLLVRRIARVEP